MARIARLDHTMVNMIAAGEVIERPASVVKELMENSIDAGATRIRVTVRDGGRKAIIVEDNGCGMDAEDLSTAFETHTTSKIKETDDLQHIATLGFRGEALASIAAVAQVKAVTRMAETTAAHSVDIDCGQASAVTPCSGDYGTVIQVRDLFYKLPARRKFLRTAPTELGHVTEQFTRIGLAHPNLHLELVHNQRELYRLEAGETLPQRIQKLFPSLEGSLGDGLIEATVSEKEFKMSAWLGRPELSRTHTRFQYVFLNGRFIRDKLVSHAIKEAYRGLLDPHRHPVVFLFIDMPFEAYDVNVHPTKSEVRFYSSNRVHSQVLGVLRETLLSTDMNVKAKLPPASNLYELPARKRSAADRREHVAEAMATFFKEHKPPPASSQFSSPRSRSEVVHSPMAGSSPGVREESPVDRVEQSVSEGRSFLQIHDSYLVAQTDDGFVVIDQHALHEKIMYERLRTRTQSGPLEAQRLLIPETLQLTEAQNAIIEQHRDVFLTMGIDIEPFGPKTVAVQTFPTLLTKANITEFVQDMIETLAEDREADTNHLLDSVLNMAACKAAIKAGQSLSDAEIQDLLAHGEQAESSSRCPHGRPTTLRFTLTELEKQFHRT